MCPDAIKTEVERLARAGMRIRLLEHGGQCYVLVEGLESQSPDWGAKAHDVLIAVPLAYETAGLDGFYLHLPYTYKGAKHNRVSGQVLSLEDKQWQQVSWHYADGKAWCTGTDSLDTHIEHVRGFFLNRGATNAM